MRPGPDVLIYTNLPTYSRAHSDRPRIYPHTSTPYAVLPIYPSYIYMFVSTRQSVSVITTCSGRVPSIHMTNPPAGFPLTGSKQLPPPLPQNNLVYHHTSNLPTIPHTRHYELLSFSSLLF